jgi:aspartyl-tRNA(Asn)/glutamyl-tRNA(Gln) amidotransferase subunit B
MKDLGNKYELVLGLEIHIQPKTRTKMFCACSADIWKSKPNTHTCPVCLGMPGGLPVPNKEAIEKVQLLGLALGCDLNRESRFDRKHYFYPDLSKGYQISQYKKPFCENGNITVGEKEFALERIHLEEDAAKSFHNNTRSEIDFNKGGMPLIELVTKPVFRDVYDASNFARKLQDIVRYLGISDCDMEKGQMRLEPNISIRKKGETSLPDYKVEIKNINSFKFMEKAVLYEITRQVNAIENGEKLIQENRGFDSDKGITYSQRSKEEAKDYRYFPEPDIPPFEFDDAYFAILKEKLPKLLSDIYSELIALGLTPQNAEYFTSYPGLDLLDKFYEINKEKLDSSNKIANLLINNLEYKDLSKKDFIEKYKKANDKISNEKELQKIIEEVITENSKQFKEYKSGKDSLVQFFIGKTMKKTKGKADAIVVKKLIEQL